MRKNGVACTQGFSLIEIMIALSLSALLCAGIFHILNAMQRLHEKQMVLSHAQEKMQWITQLLREKIHSAGDESCEKNRMATQRVMIRRFTADEAFDQLGLTIKPKTHLLQLRECVRLHGRFRYLPIAFFVANTFRFNQRQKEIDALFFKIAHHPREEVITAMSDFRVRLYKIKKTMGAVKINYRLLSVNDPTFSEKGVLVVTARRIGLK